MSCLIIPLTTLYNEYIDRPKLSEQKKPVDYIVPPPSQEGSEQIIFSHILFKIIKSLTLCDKLTV